MIIKLFPLAQFGLLRTFLTEIQPFYINCGVKAAFFKRNFCDSNRNAVDPFEFEEIMELYIKAGKIDGEVGDCPFAHYVRCVMNYKKLDYNLRPCKPDSKPSWLVDDLDGKMPCLRQGDFKMVESSAIVEHLEKKFPDPSLEVEEMEEIFKVQSGFFPAMAKFIKAPSHQRELEENLLAQLKILNDHLMKMDSTFFAGSKISLVDFNLAPKLYHMDATLKEFYPEIHEKVKTYTALHKYMETMFEESAFKDTIYPRETIIWGWSAARSK